MMFWIAALYVVHLMNRVAEWKLFSKSTLLQVILGATLCVCFAGVGATRLQPCMQELLEQQNLYRIFGDRERGIYQYFADHEENFYLTTSFMWGTGGYIITEPEGLADNYAFINGYMIMIPEWAEKLQANGIDVDHILDSAAENDKIHFILNWGSDGLVELIQGYLDEAHDGKQIVKVDEIIGFPVYSIQ